MTKIVYLNKSETLRVDEVEKCPFLDQENYLCQAKSTDRYVLKCNIVYNKFPEGCPLEDAL